MEIKAKTARRENFSSASRKLSDIQYIVVHYTGNRGDTAKNNADYFAREIVKPSASAHYFVDENEVWQSVPENHNAWHCGTSGTYYHRTCRNANSIGVEVCMLDKAGRVRQGSIDRTAQLVRELMQRYGIPADRVIRHYDVTHKDCPAPMVSSPALWQEFQNQLVQEDEDMKYYEKLDEIPKGEMRDTVKLLMDRKAIAGNGSGLHLSEDMVRLMVYNRRMGLYQ